MNTCESPTWNLGLEARETEPQPCGEPARWLIASRRRAMACNAHVGSLLWEIEKEFIEKFGKRSNGTYTVSMLPENAEVVA